MKELNVLGKLIREKRLSLNLRMEDVAKKAGITRATLWSIEKGNGSFSANSLFKVMNLLGLTINVNEAVFDNGRDRATRINTLLDKKINRFIVMCVEQYAGSVNESSASVYKKMLKKGVIRDLTDDYEDLHGMSTMYLNDYIKSLLED